MRGSSETGPSRGLPAMWRPAGRLPLSWGTFPLYEVSANAESTINSEIEGVKIFHCFCQRRAPHRGQHVRGLRSSEEHAEPVETAKPCCLPVKVVLLDNGHLGLVR